ncbi:MAG TPA: hypothetical protein VKY65_03665 [Alphaproteobacteria bacterium]|nr:hypothetical protein [Alphaproteobacteria bacterium]
MVRTAESCRRLAAEFRSLADATADEWVRAELLKLAAAYERLAAAREHPREDEKT